MAGTRNKKHCPHCEEMNILCNSLHDYDPSTCPSTHSESFGEQCNACSEIAALDVKIAQLKADLEVLAKNRCSLKEKVNHCHDQVTRGIPVEIISQIFTFYIEGIVESKTVINAAACHYRARTAGLLLLASMCRCWRRIAYTTPQLWTCIDIGVYEQIYPESQLDRLHHRLRRSGQLPLSISLVSTQRSASLFRVIGDHALRWRDLRLLVLDPAVLSDVYRNQEHQVLPCLETLDILSDGRQRDRTSGLCFPATPRLKYVEVTGVDISRLAIDWSTVTHIKAEIVPPEDIFYLFRHATSLIKLEVPEVDRMSPPLVARPKLKHSTIQDIDIYDGRTEENTPLRPFYFDGVVFPALKKLSFRTRQYAPPNIRDTMSPITNSQCTITHLTLKEEDLSLGSGSTTEDIIELLHIVPTLTHFSIRFHSEFNKGNKRDALLLYLDPWLNNQLLPNLEFLELIYHPASFIWSSFVSIFDIRDLEPRPADASGIGGEDTDTLSGAKASPELNNNPAQDRPKRRQLRHVRVKFTKPAPKELIYLKNRHPHIFEVLLQIKRSKIDLEVVYPTDDAAWLNPDAEYVSINIV